MNLAIDSNATHSADTPNVVRTSPSIRSANWLYLVTMLLVIFIGATLESAAFGWGLIATEFLLILLPTLLFLRWQHLPVIETLRFNWPGWPIMVLSGLSGIALYLLSVPIDTFMAVLWGYTPLGGPDTYPTTIGQAVPIFLGLTVAAPLCEETLFRGYIQRAYTGRNPRLALVVTALLFAFYHFRLQGLVALLPIAFTLCYLRRRSNSLWPGIAAHFGMNAAAASYLIAVGLQINWLANLVPGSLLWAVLGLLVAVAALWTLSRLTSDDQTTAAPITSPLTRFSFSALLPLIVAAALYLAIANQELTYGRQPERLATGPLALDASSLPAEARWQYDIRNVLDESVGQATCTLAATNADYLLDCQTAVRAFKVEQFRNLYQSDDYNSQLTAQWRRDDLSLVAAEQQTSAADSTTMWRLQPVAGRLNLLSNEAGTAQSLPLPDDAVLPGEWPWRFMALPFELSLGQRANFIWPSHWQPETGTTAPAVEEIAVIVLGAEPITTPAGHFIAWRVKVGRWTAWYDVNSPHTLLRYDAGFAVYVLTGNQE